MIMEEWIGFLIRRGIKMRRQCLHMACARFFVLALIFGIFQAATAMDGKILTVKAEGGGGSYTSIQSAIDGAGPGDIIDVYPGDYYEAAPNKFVGGTKGPHQFGLFFGADQTGVTLRGVDAEGKPILDPHSLKAHIRTNATNCFGYSGIFVDADNITPQGVDISDNEPYNNKTIEIVANGFKMLNCAMTAKVGALYFGEIHDSADIRIKTYQIEGSWFANGSFISINSGAGMEGAVSGRIIRNNDFSGGNGMSWAAITFNGSGTGVPWFKLSVGGATIEGNKMANMDSFIRTRGTVLEEFEWDAYLANNKFDRSVAIINPADGKPRAFDYMSGAYLMPNTRKIGASLENELWYIQPGDIIR